MAPPEPSSLKILSIADDNDRSSMAALSMGKAVTALAWRPAPKRGIEDDYGKQGSKQTERHQLAVAGEDGSLRIITHAQSSSKTRGADPTKDRL